MNLKYEHIAIVCGGISKEREISLQSGAVVEEAAKASGYKTTLIDANYDLAANLIEVKPDAIFNALHGVWGEDGLVQGLFETLNIPYTHSGVLASALAMDKAKAKAIFKEAGLPISKHKIVSRQEAASKHILPPPYVIKPIGEGSSLGIMIVREGANTPPQILTSSDWEFGNEVMVEEYVAGQEFSCAILNDEVLGIAEIITDDGKFYDYQQKYDENGAKHEVPAKVNESLTKQINEISLTAHKILGCRGTTRVDFRYNKKTNQLALLEINTQPGMMKASLVPEIACSAGMDIQTLVRNITDDASSNR